MIIDRALKENNISGDSKGPAISVIITAHDRREFLKDAITSLVNQTLDKSLFEVILVKNFDLSEIEALEVKLNLVILNSNDDSLVGDDLMRGITIARGEIITFLDDDDMFSDTKLETVLKIFNDEPSLIYYHNSQYFTVYDQRRNNNRRNFRKVLKTKDIRNNLAKLIKKYGPSSFYFNLSSISIRKDAYIGNVKYLLHLPDHPDDFFFFIGLQMEGKFFFDNLQLTTYRVHLANTSSISKDVYKNRNVYFSKKFALFEKQSKSTSQILTVISNRIIRKYLKSKESHETALMNFYRNTFSARDLIMLLRGIHCNGFRYTSWCLLTILKEKYNLF